MKAAHLDLSTNIDGSSFASENRIWDESLETRSLEGA
jgi:hypothetical protein